MSIDVRVGGVRGSGQARWRRRLARFSPLFGILLFLAAGTFAFPYTVDDAFVLARYATRFTAGAGWTMVDGPPTDGVTGPLGIVPGAVAAAWGWDPVRAQKLTGLVAAGLAVGASARFLMRRSGGYRTAPVFIALVVSQTAVVIWSVAGLETGLAIAAATSATLGVLSRRLDGVTAGVGIGALAWLRPECALFSAVLLVGSVGRAGWQRMWAISGVSVVALLASRWALFGGVLPLSFWAKPADLALGLGYALRGTAVVTGCAGCVLVSRAAHRESRALVVAVALVAHVFAVMLAGGDWMPGFRLFAPIVPAYALLAALGVRERRGVLQSAALVAALVVPAGDLAIQSLPARGAGIRLAERGGALCDVLQVLLADSPEEGAVAAVDIGYLGHHCEIERIVDLAGITEPRIAHQPGAHLAKRFPLRLLEERGVEVVILRSFVRPELAQGRIVHMSASPLEMRIAGTRWTWERFHATRYVQWSPGYHYIFLVRRERSTSRESVWQDDAK